MYFEFCEGCLSLCGPGKGECRGGEFAERGGYPIVVPDKPAVKIGKPKEPLKLFKAQGYGPLYHCLDLPRVCLNLPTLKDVAQKSHRRDMKFTLLRFDK